MTAHLSSCSVQMGKINGRTLREALDLTKARWPGDIPPISGWVPVCPRCDAYALGIETLHPFPFMCGNGVMRTASDLDWDSGKYVGETLQFCGLSFTRSALASAIALIQMSDATTREVVEQGQAFLGDPSPSKALAFSESVCRWGQGMRVWGNLQRIHKDGELGSLLEVWLVDSASGSDPKRSIEIGSSISGLGVSFASKHLRLLAPHKYAVLDDVLSQGLGFALNPAGYQLFLNSLIAFSRGISFSGDLASLEAGIFLLVRQQVRSENLR